MSLHGWGTLVVVMLFSGSAAPEVRADEPDTSAVNDAAAPDDSAKDEAPDRAGDTAAAGDAAQRPADAAGAEPTAEDFAKLYQQWQDKLKQLTTLRTEYQAATPERRKQITDEFTELLRSGERLLPSLSLAAEKKLAAAPDPDSDEASLLREYVRDLMRQDKYEEAARLSDVLIEHGAGGKGMQELSGVAAFVTGDYDRADERFAAATKERALGQKAQDYQKQLGYYRKIWKEEQAFRTAEAQADDLPRVKFITSKGDIVIELFENEAPQTVGNFVNLVEKKFYDGIAFHRVLPGFMAQGGDPNGDGTGGPGYRIPCECLGDVFRKHFRGSLSMAKQVAPNTGGSQFFINFVPTRHLDGKHTVFGRVIEGMDVLASLQRRDPGSAGSPDPDRIVKAVVLRKRDHEYKPTRLPE